MFLMKVKNSMDFIMKRKIWFWILIILVIINTVALITIILQRDNPQVPVPSAPAEEMEFRGINHFLRHELDLTDTQFTEFRRLRRESMQNSANIMRELHRKRNMMLDELVKSNPSQHTLNKLAEDIGQLHKALKLETFNHFMELKELCTAEQRQRLNQFFMEIKSKNPRPWHDRPRHGQGHRRLMNRNLQ